VPGSEFISVPTPPTDFDPPAWIASLRRLRSLGVDRLHLTHGGRIETPDAWLDAVERRFEAESAELLGIAAAPLDRAAAIERYRQWLHPRAAAAGVDREANAAFLGRAFLEMNLAGARGWLDRVAASAG
jgi:glyoxylase-like metal-dependent hydrolase (beta-lactamase superfamily II)